MNLDISHENRHDYGLRTSVTVVGRNRTEVRFQVPSNKFDQLTTRSVRSPIGRSDNTRFVDNGLFMNLFFFFLSLLRFAFPRRIRSVPKLKVRFIRTRFVFIYSPNDPHSCAEHAYLHALSARSNKRTDRLRTSTHGAVNGARYLFTSNESRSNADRVRSNRYRDVAPRLRMRIMIVGTRFYVRYGYDLIIGIACDVIRTTTACTAVRGYAFARRDA